MNKKVSSKLLPIIIATLFIYACGPIASKGAQAINKTLSKSAKEVVEVTDNIPTRNINEISLVSSDMTELNSYIARNFSGDPDVNYLYKINEKHSQLPKDWTGEFDDIWENSIKNNEPYFNDSLYTFFADSFNSKEDFFAFLPKAESVLIASILGVTFTYTDELDAAQGGTIKDKNLMFKPLTKQEITNLHCSQAHDLISIRTKITYQAFIKNLDKCPLIKLKLEDLEIEDLKK